MATKTKIISLVIYTLHCNYRLLGTFVLSLLSIVSILLMVCHVCLSSDNSAVKGLKMVKSRKSTVWLEHS